MVLYLYTIAKNEVSALLFAANRNSIRNKHFDRSVMKDIKRDFGSHSSTYAIKDRGTLPEKRQSAIIPFLAKQFHSCFALQERQLFKFEFAIT